MEKKVVGFGWRRTMREVMLRIAEKLQKLGSKYYKQGDTSKTAVFWELEQVFKDIAEEVGEEEGETKK